MRVGDRVAYVGSVSTYIGQADGTEGIIQYFFEACGEQWADVRWDHGKSWSYPVRDLMSEHPHMEETVFDLEDIELAEMIIGEMK